MADTLDNVNLIRGVWTDLYSATGITVGTKISVQNSGDSIVRLAVTSTQPDVDTSAYSIIQPGTNLAMENEQGDSGAWAMSNNQNGRVNVRVV